MTTDTIEISFADDFFEQIRSLDPSDYKRVMTAVDDLRRNPDSPGLRLKALRGPLKGFMSIRAAQDLRVLLERRGNAFLVLTGGSRADVYKKAENGRLLVNPNTGFIGFVSPESPRAHEAPAVAVETEERKPRPFDHWSSQELAALPLAAGAADQLRSLVSEDDFFSLDLNEADQEMAFEIIELTPEQWDARQHATPEQAEALANEDRDRLVDAVARFGAQAGLSPFLSGDELERLLTAPIEEWMLFLHPDQRSVVDRHYNGPARVRGSAGTGKTVVLLHRAAALADRYDPQTSDDGGQILVTTFIRSLPPVLEHLYRRLPNSRPGAIEFTNVDKLAYRVCAEAGERPSLDGRAVEAARAAAWKHVVSDASALQRLGITEAYVSEEVTAVIKGRGIADLDSYLMAKRTGRRLQLGDAARREVWAFAEAWNEGLRKRGVVDFADVVLRARDLARARETPAYRCALVDEAQDLTLAGLQLIRSLVNGPEGDRPDGLFLAGDGAQRIYPGGFTLRQAGVEVRGRTTVLKVNYRNTSEVLGAALATTGADVVEDLAEEFSREDDAGDTLRHGHRPLLLVATDDANQADLIGAQIDELVGDESNGISSGDVAVICPSNRLAKAMQTELKARHIPTMDLNDYDGVPNASIKVGTHHRVKGLEFKAVILSDITEGVFPRTKPTQVSDEEWAEKEAAANAELFVAMTRARDRLVVTCVRNPSPMLEGAFDQFEVSESPPAA